jgi:uncharacterized protein YbjT (DUF2867 family)
MSGTSGTTRPILILGGKGKTGRRVAERLTARGLNVRLGSRRGQPPFDWENKATWEKAVQGVEAAYITYYPDGEVLDGRNSYVTDGVQQALGRKPKDFSDYARETAASGVWNRSLQS